MPRKGQRIKNQPGYRKFRSKSGRGPNRWHIVIRHIPRESLSHQEKVQKENETEAKLSVEKTIDFLTKKMNMDEQEFLEWTEKNVPNFTERVVQTFYPGDHLQRYFWGKIAKETTWFMIVVLRSKDPQISIHEKVKNRWEDRFYSLDQKLPRQPIINKTIVLVTKDSF